MPHGAIFATVAGFYVAPELSYFISRSNLYHPEADYPSKKIIFEKAFHNKIPKNQQWEISILADKWVY